MGGLAAEAEGIPGVYLDACATTPPAQEVMAAMADAAATAWANPSSLHGFGLAAADCLERSRWRLADLLGAGPDQLIFCSGGTEAIHTALLGSAAALEAGRVVISAVEHPATVAAAGQLARRGWSVETWPVDRFGVVNLERIDEFLAPPTRLLSLIWGQSEVGAMQPIEAIGRRCRAAGVRFHLDAVQVVGHQLVRLDTLPVDLLSCTAHKLQGPRGVGALLVRPGVSLEPMIGGGGQEGGRRGGTEPVLLAAGFAKALDLANGRLNAHGGADPIGPLRDQLLERLLPLEGIRLSGPPPGHPLGRLPHHISLLISDCDGRPLSGRRLVRALWRRGHAVSSGSACASGLGMAGGEERPSPILRAMGYGVAEASSGLRLSLGPWLTPGDLEGLPEALERARRDVVEAGAD